MKDSSSLRLATRAFLGVDSEECVVRGNKQNHRSRAVERQTLAITWVYLTQILQLQAINPAPCDRSLDAGAKRTIDLHEAISPPRGALDNDSTAPSFSPRFNANNE